VKLLLSILFAVILFGCGEDRINFEVPQPEGLRNEKTIPKKAIGTYLSLNDSSTLSITKDQIIKIVDTDIKGVLSEMDSVDRVKIKHDTAFTEVEGKTKFDINVKNDSVFYHIHYSDTLFLFSRGDILRKFKGYYFLNKERLPNYWNVIKLGVTKNGVVIGTISSEEDINNLKDLTSTKSDSVYSSNQRKGN
jgi:hypothetical protein